MYVCVYVLRKCPRYVSCSYAFLCLYVLCTTEL